MTDPNPDPIPEAHAARRWSGKDAEDPALATTPPDNPATAAEIERRRRIDEAISKALRSEMPPPDLRDRLLALRDTTATAPPRPAIIAFPRLILPVAAAIAILLALGWAFLNRAPHAADPVARHAMSLSASDSVTLGKISSDQNSLRNWLAARGAPHTFAIPDPLRALPALGCQAFTIDGRQVSLLCFQLPDKRVVHLFVKKSSESRSPATRDNPMVTRLNSQTTLVWSDDAGNTFYLTSRDASETTLRSLV